MISKYSFLPIAARLRGKLVGPVPIRSLATSKVELTPPDEFPALPVISLRNEFDRVRGVGPLSTIEGQHEWITCARTRHGPTLAYRFENAVLADHTVYVPGGYEVARSGDKRVILPRKHEEYDQAQLCTYAASNIFFGHWLRDALTMELLAEQRGLAALSYAKEPWMHESGYREMVNLPGRAVSFASVRDLWIIDDRGLNEEWRARFRELRTRVLRAVSNGGPTHVFLSRGRSGAPRELLNSSEIANMLVNRGFTVIEPEALSPFEIAHSLASAKVVISVEGSALNHVQFALPENSAIIAIQPPERFNAFHKILADFSNLRFGYVVADSASEGAFVLEPRRLLRTLDLVEEAIIRN
jgi:capsular polysaccharide biosynthesis protein